ncbi:hypothetical protein [Alcanivorax sediminis]|uniref:Uncharacterized protein n=1 Tax=Alcanivorax sediminis TaxID=2663008 RepID=A0A6N7LVR1_9GAMM|nr:hypothetical protein [Alcanivorax sediminis]MQX54353.1 hypothetical protein [Alcanivorax sediminis]
MIENFKRQASCLKFFAKFFIVDLWGFIKAHRAGARRIDPAIFSGIANKAVVLGNGPSIKSDREEIKSRESGCDFWCVNNFCDDPLYETLKPRFYLFFDEYFFSDSAHHDFVERRNKTFDKINSATSWGLTVIVPYHADLDIIRARVTNPLISFKKINVRNYEEKDFSALGNVLFSSGYYSPPQINVLILACFLSVWAGYEVIEIFGADMSFHNDVDVDQVTNELVITHRHFNLPDEKEVLRKNPEKVEKWRMSELLDISARTFYAHQMINEFSKRRSCSLINRSSYSLIDSYSRK